jgi:hypothetical protein
MVSVRAKKNQQVIENQKKRNHLHRRDHRLFSREAVPSLITLLNCRICDLLSH